MGCVETWIEQAAAQVENAVTGFLDAGGAPGAVAIVGDATATRVISAGAVAPGLAAPTVDTRYDVASLTKIMPTWVLAGTAVADGALDLDKPVSTYLGPSSHPGSAITTRQMLSHTTGLRATTRFDEYLGSGVDLAEHILREDLESRPGEHLRYINRGFVLLGLVLERIHGTTLDALATAHVWRPWGLHNTSYGPLPASPDVAPTERRLLGARAAWGVVHDESAALMGGVAGHAGVFSTASDLQRFAREVVEHSRADTPFGRYVRESFEVHAAGDGTSRGLAWIVVPETGVAYHHGFTGTSLYVAPAAERFIVVLTNAVFVSRARERLMRLRSAALRAMG